MAVIQNGPESNHFNFNIAPLALVNYFSFAYAVGTKYIIFLLLNWRRYHFR